MSEFVLNDIDFVKHTSPEELAELFAELSELRGAIRDFDWRGTPNVNYHFFLTAHSREEDFEGLSEAIADADVVIPEVPGWSHKTLVAMRNIAKGKKRHLRPNPSVEGMTDEQARHVFGDAKAIQGLLFDTHKRIEFIDLPREQAAPLYKQVFRATTFTFGQFESVDEMVDHYVYAKSMEAKFQLTREINMMGRLDKLFAEQKEPLNVLISLGADHTFITHQLMDRGEKVKRTFYPKPLIYPYRDEMTRRLIFGVSFDSTLAMKAISEGGLAFHYSSENEAHTANSIDAAKAMRESLDQYEPAELVHFLGRAIQRNRRR